MHPIIINFQKITYGFILDTPTKTLLKLLAGLGFSRLAYPLQNCICSSLLSSGVESFGQTLLPFSFSFCSMPLVDPGLKPTIQNSS